jgi:hypothetical protein
MVITQESAESFTTQHRLLAADIRTPREQQDVALPLMIPFGMVMLDIFTQPPTQGNSRHGDRAVSTKCPRYRVVLRHLSILDGGDRTELAGAGGFETLHSK